MDTPFHATDAAVVAIDVGTSLTKVAWTLADGSNSRRSLAFPSAGVQVDDFTADERVAMQARNVCHILSDEGALLVGPDALQFVSGWHFPMANDSPLSESIRYALTVGALHFTGLSQVDMLCLGATCEAVGDGVALDSLARRLVGAHHVDGRTIFVHQVRVIADPVAVAAPLKWGSRHQAESSDYRRLIIEAGFASVRWAVVRCDRQRIVACGKYATLGEFAALREVAGTIERDRPDWGDVSIRALECAIRGTNARDEPPRLDDLVPYVNEPRTVSLEALSDLADRLEEYIDMDVFLVGGGAARFLPLLERVLQRRSPEPLHRPAFAVARGLLAIGLANYARSSVSEMRPGPIVEAASPNESGSPESGDTVTDGAVATERVCAAPARGRGKALDIDVRVVVSRDSHPELFQYLQAQRSRNRPATLLRMADLHLLQSMSR